MDAGTALQQLKQGQKIRREGWPEGQYAAKGAKEDLFILCRRDTTSVRWNPSQEELMAEDYRFYNPDGPELTDEQREAQRLAGQPVDETPVREFESAEEIVQQTQGMVDDARELDRPLDDRQPG